MPDRTADPIDAVDALLAAVAAGRVLPAPAERVRLREAAGLTGAAVAQALGARPASVTAWEAGRAEPRGEKLEAYRRLLEGLAQRYPAPPAAPAPAPAADVLPAPAAVAAVPVELDQVPGGGLVTAEPAPCVRCGRPTPYRADGRPHHIGGFCASATVPGGTAQAPAPAAAALAAAPCRAAPAAAPRRAAPSRPAAASRAGKAPAKKTAAGAGAEDWEAAAAAKYPAGPLAVLDTAPGKGTPLVAHLVDGRTLEVAATSLAQVTAWALGTGLGSPRLHRHGKDGDPLVVLADDAAQRLGLPPMGREKGDYEQRAGRLPETHRAVKALAAAGWQLTRRGLGPWARIYRTPDAGKRECVQFCVPAWGALASGGWQLPSGLDAPGLARLLGAYAARVTTPRGSTAVSGLELMTALRPPTRAVRTEAGWTSGPVAGSLHRAVDAAPPEVPDVHPLAQGRGPGPEEVLLEEAWDWHRVPTGQEAALPFAVGLDVNAAFLAAAGRLTVGLSEPVHELEPVFDKRLPGCWLADLSGIELDPRLPSPFTPGGERPTGPAWYATPTLAYAAELGGAVRPLEGWLRHESGPYLDPWHKRLRDAYMATMDRLGVPAGPADQDPAEFLAAMARLKDGDPVELAVLAAVKQTAKGGIGKLRERPRGHGYRPGQPWAALERPTWRPDIRAALIATARVNLHRKLLRTAALTGRYPIGVLSDCAVYPAAGPHPLDVVPLGPDGLQVPGGLRLGVAPGMVKHEGTRALADVLEFIAAGVNPARHIKGDGHDAADEGE